MTTPTNPSIPAYFSVVTKATYLDNAATTPVRPEVLQAMLPYLSDEVFGNPSSSHRFGRAARDGVDNARQRIAQALGVEPGHVIFTAGGTEADNLAILGAAQRAKLRGRPFRVAVTTVEHAAVRESARAVDRFGGKAIHLPVDARGQLERETLQRALEDGVAVVSAMWVNNETGIIQDIPAVASACAEAGTLFHTDAVQAVGKIPCSLADGAVSLLAISGHKMGAPQGVGALIVRDRRALAAIVHGGGQQFGLRSGTENVAGIVGLGCAVQLAVAEVDETADQLGRLRDRFERGVAEAVPDARVIGADAPRAPHISNVVIPGIDSEAMLMHLDLAGVACASGSACHTGAATPSEVLLALGVAPELASRSLRFSFYKQNGRDDVDRALEILPATIGKVRALAEALGR